jgi:DHA2 family methylenomycin A resistance protein-like MFS transporter
VAGSGAVAASDERTAGVGLAPLLAVCCGYFMVILDVTIVNVAAPAIGRDLGASLTDLQWIVDGYTVAFAGLLLLGGALGDRWGNRRVFCLGVAVFTIASLGCAVAGGAITLTAFRLLEGCGAALLVPGSLALLQQVYRTQAARARAFGLWGAIAGVAATAGPLVGGVLTTTVGWRWVFAINLPVGVLCLVLTMATVGPSPRDPGRIIDPLGQAAVVVTVAALITALNEAGRQGIGGPAVIGGVLVAAAAAGVLVLRERFGSHPPLPLPMLRSRPLTGGTAIGLLFNFGFYGMIFAASVYFQQHQHLSAAVAGLALLPAMAVTMVASALSGRLSDRFSHRRLMLIGLLTACVGLALWAVVGDAASYPVLAVAMLACGFGTSFTLTGATSTVMGAAPTGYAGTASAALNTARQTGSAAGVAISGSLIALAGLPTGVATFMAVGAAGYLLGAVLTVLCVPANPR